MKSLLWATLAAASVSLPLVGVALMLDTREAKDVSPRIGGSADQTIAPTAARPGASPSGYPIARVREVVPHGALHPHATPPRREERRP